MRRITIFIVLLLTVVACSGNKKVQRRAEPVEPEPVGPTAQELYLKGNAFLGEGAWGEAVEQYDEAIGKEPELWEAQMNRGIALSRQAKFADALDAFNQAMKAGGAESAVFYFNLGNLYQDRGMYSAAVDAYRHSMTLEDAPNVDTLLNLAAAYVFLRRYDDANATYEYIRTLVPDDARPVHGLALVHQINERFGDAVTMYEEAHAVDPSYALSYYNKSRCLAAMQRWDEAIQTLRHYKSMSPNERMTKRANTLLGIYERKRDGGP